MRNFISDAYCLGVSSVIAVITTMIAKTVHRNSRLRRKNDSMPTRSAKLGLVEATGVCICIPLHNSLPIKWFPKRGKRRRTRINKEPAEPAEIKPACAGVVFGGDGRESSIGHLKMQLQKMNR